MYDEKSPSFLLRSSFFIQNKYRSITYNENVEVLFDEIREESLSHLLLRHPVKPVVFLPRFLGRGSTLLLLLFFHLNRRRGKLLLLLVHTAVVLGNDEPVVVIIVEGIGLAAAAGVDG